MTDTYRMMIVEDDDKLRKMLKEYFLTQGFEVETLRDGDKADQHILDFQPDIVLLDLMLPVTDGLTICRQIRAQFSGKILMLTASNDDFDHVAGLETGADDFVSKPIKPRVLLARIRTLLRRESYGDKEEDDKQKIRIGKLSLYVTYKKCEYRGELVPLTDTEFDLLCLLVSEADTVLSRDYLTLQLRGIEYDGIDRTVDNRIVRLRKLLNDDSVSPQKIQTIRGKGYLFASQYWRE